MSLESKIEKSSLYKILSTDDEASLDANIDWSDRDTRMMAKKFTVIMLGRKKGFLSSKALKVASDRQMVTSYLEGKVDIQRLKRLLEIELDVNEGIHRSVNELLLDDYATHEDLMRLFNSTHEVQGQALNSPIRVEAIPFLEVADMSNVPSITGQVLPSNNHSQTSNRDSVRDDIRGSLFSTQNTNPSQTAGVNVPISSTTQNLFDRFSTIRNNSLQHFRRLGINFDVVRPMLPEPEYSENALTTIRNLLDSTGDQTLNLSEREYFQSMANFISRRLLDYNTLSDEQKIELRTTVDSLLDQIAIREEFYRMGHATRT